MHHLTVLLHSVDPSGDAYLTQEEHVVEMLTRIKKQTNSKMQHLCRK